MKASKVRSAISALIDSKIPSLLWGPPGIGKSSILKQVSQDKGMEFIDLRLSMMDANSIELLPSSLPKEGKGILLFDQLNSAPSSVQGLVYQLIFDRQVGEYKLPDGWATVVSENLGMDSGVVDKMPAHLANRFVHLDMEVDINDWKVWAYSAGIDERVIAYIGYKNEDLFTFNPSFQGKSFATPRSWESVSGILRSGMDEDLLLDVISGAIGKGRAISFLSFSKVVEELPDIEAILEKAEAEYPTQPDILYMLASVLVSYLLRYNNEQHLENVLKYTLELQPEFAVMIVQDLQRSGLVLENSPSFALWVRKYA